MKHILKTLEKKFDTLGNENLTYYLIGGQILSFILIQFRPEYSSTFALEGSALIQGQWWRLITFLFYPISRDLFFAVFVWYIFYLYGSVLERRWGSFRFFAYLFISYMGSIIASIIFPFFSITNGYMYSSLFLAFAYLFPDFQLLIFFILPVKVKWLALIAWVGITGSFLFGPISTKVLTFFSVSNFLIFFGKDVLLELRSRLTHLPISSISVVKRKAYHVCAVCGDNEVDNPRMQIRYCSKCVPSLCYCIEHIRNHQHVIKSN